MRIHNAHSRLVRASTRTIASLLDTIGQTDDALYPPLWEPMRLDGRVAVGASGTHGTISAYQPGELIEFTFPAGLGITGTHSFTVNPVDSERIEVRHVVRADATPPAWLAWKAAIEPSHDAVLEQVLDRLETAVGTPPSRPHRLSRYARLLRRLESPRAHEVDVEQTGLTVGSLPRVDFSDVFAIERRRETSSDADEWAEAIFDDPPRWVSALMTIRERLVGYFGFDQESAEMFTPIARTDDEVLFGVDAGHLDFRTSVRCESEQVVLSGAVTMHNLRGRIYFALVRPIHPFVIRAMLNRAARRLAHRSAASAETRTPDMEEAPRTLISQDSRGSSFGVSNGT
ncbi:DUF2867 domain-containing protein [Brevibacterium sp.]|uniref:DUF2867 domain-containing protein n=1 Tax=Brevibacterium sp. TaxID=1701 RepID=UPI002810AD67|nr:DUF2867 domain-containing protein [Brevibacterium sp.]